MKKTGQEWLNEMPWFVRKAWEKNVKKSASPDAYNRRRQFLLNDISDRFEFVYGSFVFCHTPEGHYFWRSIGRGEKTNFFKFVLARFKNTIS